MGEALNGLKRTMMCGEPREVNVGEKITLMGWVQRNRKLGGLQFIDLRDRTGIMQIVFGEEINAESFEKAKAVRPEYCIAVTGEVVLREAPNNAMETGMVELKCESIKVLSESETPPIYIKEGLDAAENIRLKYRYLDLRRPDMQKIFMIRNNGLKRTMMCGEPREVNVGEKITLMGWVQRNRKLGGLQFIDLRDRTGIMQIVFGEEINAESFEKAKAVRPEYCIAVTGEVVLREAPNNAMETGMVELKCESIKVLSESETPPIYIKEGLDAAENIRLKYRYLDLRRPDMQKIFMIRNRATNNAESFEKAKAVRPEYCIAVTGEVVLREAPNNSMETGMVELKCESKKVLSEEIELQRLLEITLIIMDS